LEHAQNAIRAALAAVERVEAARKIDERNGAPAFSIKIGINSGIAVVGNVGTEKRFNYTAVGETVNIASRLEGVPGIYQCRIVIGPQTARLSADEFLMRELDRVLVKGGNLPIAIYEPQVERSCATEEQIERVAQFAKGLESYRARDFDKAAKIWEALASIESKASSANSGEPYTESPASVMAQRARDLMAHSPPASWDGVHVLATK
jgi:adenylate cyclase